jgi:hypothetical protein
MNRIIPVLLICLVCFSAVPVSAEETDDGLMSLIDGKQFAFILNMQEYRLTFKVSFPEFQRGIALLQWTYWENNVRCSDSQIIDWVIEDNLITVEGGLYLMMGFDGHLFVLCPDSPELVPAE